MLVQRELNACEWDLAGVECRFASVSHSGAHFSRLQVENWRKHAPRPRTHLPSDRAGESSVVTSPTCRFATYALGGLPGRHGGSVGDRKSVV